MIYFQKKNVIKLKDAEYAILEGMMQDIVNSTNNILINIVDKKNM